MITYFQLKSNNTGQYFYSALSRPLALSMAFFTKTKICISFTTTRRKKCNIPLPTQLGQIDTVHIYTGNMTWCNFVQSENGIRMSPQLSRGPSSECLPSSFSPLFSSTQPRNSQVAKNKQVDRNLLRENCTQAFFTSYCTILNLKIMGKMLMEF